MTGYCIKMAPISMPVKIWVVISTEDKLAQFIIKHFPNSAKLPRNNFSSSYSNIFVSILSIILVFILVFLLTFILVLFIASILFTPSCLALQVSSKFREILYIISSLSHFNFYRHLYFLTNQLIILFS